MPILSMRTRKNAGERSSVCEANYWTLEDKYHFVKADTSGLSKDKLCQMLEISRSAYYAWLTRRPSSRSLKDKATLRALIGLHNKYPALGLDSLHQMQMLRPVFGASRNRIHRLKKQAKIYSLRHKAYKVTTNSNHKNPVAPNLTKLLQIPITRTL